MPTTSSSFIATSPGRARSWPRRSASLAALLLAGALLAADSGPAAQTPRHPNIVLILIDDLGWRDIGVAGSPFYDTPSVDRLAAEGARFTRFYTASPVCSPTRASIQTGRNPARLHITNWIGGEETGRPLREADYLRALPLEETTLAEALAPAGYTTGYIGKWHLGEPPAMPRDQGYAVSVAVNHAGQPGAYFPPYGKPAVATKVPDLDDDPPGAYLTDRLTDEALKFIEAHRAGPFFLMLAHYAVHTPLQSKDDLTAKYRVRASALPPLVGPAFQPEGWGAQTRQRQDHAVYAGMVESMDQSVGRILAALAALELADDTIVVFMSDNGGLSTVQNSTSGPTSNLPLRAGKGWLYEGGIRAPLIVRWPGHVRAGSIIDTPGISDDILPTLLEMAGVERRSSRELDGVSLAPLFSGGAVAARPFYWHFPHYHGSGHRPAGAVQCGRYKLIQWFEDGRTELYDLQADEGETHDLAGTMPGKVEELRTQLEGWRTRVGAAMPVKK